MDEWVTVLVLVAAGHRIEGLFVTKEVVAWATLLRRKGQNPGVRPLADNIALFVVGGAGKKNKTKILGTGVAPAKCCSELGGHPPRGTIEGALWFAHAQSQPARYTVEDIDRRDLLVWRGHHSIIRIY